MAGAVFQAGQAGFRIAIQCEILHGLISEAAVGGHEKVGILQLAAS